MRQRSSDKTGGPTDLQRAVRACPSAFRICALFSLIINVLMLAPPVYMLQVYDRVLTTGRIETLVVLTLMATIAIAVMCALDALRTCVTIRVGCWLNEELVAGRVQDASYGRWKWRPNSGGGPGLR